MSGHESDILKQQYVTFFLAFPHFISMSDNSIQFYENAWKMHDNVHKWGTRQQQLKRVRHQTLDDQVDARVIFCTRGGAIMGHKHVCAVSSSYFQEFFLSGFSRIEKYSILRFVYETSSILENENFFPPVFCSLFTFRTKADILRVDRK